MTEYESQHAAWQKDHDQVMAEINVWQPDHDQVMTEMDAYLKIGPTWTVVTLPNNWPRRPGLPTWGDCYDWCMATWGRNDDWVYMGPGKFHFKNKSDAAMFILKWVQ